jgi:hypothetical protein
MEDKWFFKYGTRVAKYFFVGMLFSQLKECNGNTKLDKSSNIQKLAIS